MNRLRSMSFYFHSPASTPITSTSQMEGRSSPIAVCILTYRPQNASGQFASMRAWWDSSPPTAHTYPSSIRCGSVSESSNLKLFKLPLQQGSSLLYIMTCGMEDHIQSQKLPKITYWLCLPMWSILETDFILLLYEISLKQPMLPYLCNLLRIRNIFCLTNISMMIIRLFLVTGDRDILS